MARDGNHEIQALVELRERIFDGALPPGTRLAEIPLAESLGVSRTPIRLALARLQQEGLVIQLPAGGFVVRAFQISEVTDAIKVRGVLEGLAARLVAEHGVTRKLSRDLHDCLDEGDQLLSGSGLEYAEFQSYVAMNSRFHRLVVKAAENEALERALGLNDKVPFAAADALVSAQAIVPNAQDVLLFAHAQHHGLVEALEASESVYAQSIAEQHALRAVHNLRAALRAVETANVKIPGLSLLKVSPSDLSAGSERSSHRTALAPTD